MMAVLRNKAALFDMHPRHGHVVGMDHLALQQRIQLLYFYLVPLVMWHRVGDFSTANFKSRRQSFSAADKTKRAPGKTTPARWPTVLAVVETPARALPGTPPDSPAPARTVDSGASPPRWRATEWSTPDS